MPTSKAPRKPRRKPGSSPQGVPVKVAGTQRTETNVELGGKIYQAYCPKRSKFKRVFSPENLHKLMLLDDEDEAIAEEAERYTGWMLDLVFGPKAGAEIFKRLRSDDVDEEIDEDVIGEVLMHLCVIWTPDLAANAHAMKERVAPLTDKMESMADELKRQYGPDQGS